MPVSIRQLKQPVQGTMQAGILRFFIKLLPAMKRLLPHLFYLLLIAGLGIFFWFRLKAENQWIVLINRTTDEAQATAQLGNRKMQNEISLQARAYPSPKNTELMHLGLSADSLIGISYTDTALHDSLSSRLWMLTNRDRWLTKVFKNLLPSKKQAGVSSMYSVVMAQTDSLRIDLAYAVLLNYCAELMGRPVCNSGWGPDILASHTVRCPVMGQIFETDIALADYANLDIIQLKVDGRLYPVKEGLANFIHTYPWPGVYPLHVKAKSRLWGNDSLTISEKTFYLHVSQ